MGMPYCQTHGKCPGQPVLQIVRLCVVLGVGKRGGGGGVIDCVRRRLHWRGQGRLDFPAYSEGLLFSSGGNALTGVGGREEGT